MNLTQVLNIISNAFRSGPFCPVSLNRSASLHVQLLCMHKTKTSRYKYISESDSFAYEFFKCLHFSIECTLYMVLGYNLVVQGTRMDHAREMNAVS